MLEFENAIAAAEQDMGCKGIGTLGEKSLHLALKYYFAPDPETHERQVGGFVADAVTEAGIIEVQTRGLSRLKETTYAAERPSADLSGHGRASGHHGQAAAARG